MSEIKPTPGPWEYSRYDYYETTRFYIFQKEGAPYTPNFSDAATLICETVLSERIQIQEANARLIAAAPELLAALKQLDEVFCREDDGTREGRDFGCNALIDARAAIAKATMGAA